MLLPGFSQVYFSINSLFIVSGGLGKRVSPGIDKLAVRTLALFPDHHDTNH
jgi:hypothetical protein